MLTSINDDNIKDAVALWLSDTSTAEATFGHIKDWETKDITNMCELFKNGINGDTTNFDEDISDWNIENVTNMSFMFSGASIFNQSIGQWDTSKVTDMRAMFVDCLKFNQDIGSWDTSLVTDMKSMFSKAKTFNQDIGGWVTTNVTRMNSMFTDACDFNQNISTKLLTNISGTKYIAWDTSSVIDMSEMFHITDYESAEGNFNNGQSVIVTGTLGTNPLYWNTTNVTNMYYMFNAQRKFNQCISTDYVTFLDGTSFWSWDTSKVTDMTRLLAYTENFNNGELAGYSNKPLNWNTSNVTSMSYLFGRYNFLINNNLETSDPDYSIFDGRDAYNQPMNTKEITIYDRTYTVWDTSKVEDMSVMFQLASHFNQDIENWNTSKVTDMENMFDDTTSFNQPIGEWDTSSVTNMVDMFADAKRFNQDIGQWDTSKVITMTMMFYNAKSFNQNINSWSLESLKSANNMFWGAKSINQPFLNFRDAGVRFFGSNGNIETYTGNSGIKVQKMFFGATSQTLKGNFCFLAGTPVETEQGLIEIEKITSENTIEGIQVKKVVSFENDDLFMILFKKNSISENIPNQDTLVSKNHRVYINNHLTRAKNLINKVTIFHKFMGTKTVYNMVLEGSKAGRMKVNNMLVETMNPKIKRRILPKDFNWEIYKELNPDLKHLNKSEIEKHYFRHAQKENRINKSKPETVNHLPKDFNWKVYKKLNPDLNHLDKIKTEKHYLKHGQKENRIYKYKQVINKQLPKDFNWEVYTYLHKDLRNLDKPKAINHYLKHGKKENRSYLTTIGLA
jgi:surface protein